MNNISKYRRGLLVAAQTILEYFYWFKSNFTGTSRKSPLISVIIPNYNHAIFLGMNLEGLISQSYQNWEAIVVDDCSTDNSDEVIRNYAKGDPRIKPIFLAKNGGAVAAFNCGFSLAIGELFYGSAADDFISNNKFFEIAVNKLRIRPDAAGVVFKTRVVEASTSEPLWDMGGVAWLYFP